MAHIHRREYVGKPDENGKPGKKSVYWVVRYLDPAGRERSKSFRRKVDAEKWLHTIEASKLRGDYIDPAAGKRKFSDLAEGWRTIQVHRGTTAAQVETHVRVHMLPTFGDRPIASIRPSEIQAWVKDRQAHLQPATVKVAYRYLAAIFKMAATDGIIAKTPCVSVKLPKVERPTVIPLTTEQVARLAAATPDRYRALIVAGAGAGLRLGEALGLTVPHVDFLRRTLHVEQQLIELSNQPPFLAPPKTPSSDRKIPLGDVVVETLAQQLEAFPAVCSLESTTDRLERLVFTDRDGQMMRRRSFGRIWGEARLRADLPAGVTFHDLRHYYASLLIRRGASVKVVQARLGHKSATETLDTYSHLWEDDEDLTRRATDAELETVTGKRREKLAVQE